MRRFPACFSGQSFHCKKGDDERRGKIYLQCHRLRGSRGCHRSLRSFLNVIVQVICEDVAAVEAKFAAAYYQYDPNALFLVGITGTTGRQRALISSNIFLIAQRPCGLIGTSRDCRKECISLADQQPLMRSRIINFSMRCAHAGIKQR